MLKSLLWNDLLPGVIPTAFYTLQIRNELQEVVFAAPKLAGIRSAGPARTRRARSTALTRGAAGHVEHYANSEDSRARCAVINFKKKTSDESKCESEANIVATVRPEGTDHGNLIWRCVKTKNNNFEQAWNLKFLPREPLQAEQPEPPAQSVLPETYPPVDRVSQVRSRRTARPSRTPYTYEG